MLLQAHHSSFKLLLVLVLLLLLLLLLLAPLLAVLLLRRHPQKQQQQQHRRHRRFPWQQQQHKESGSAAAAPIQGCRADRGVNAAQAPSLPSRQSHLLFLLSPPMRLLVLSMLLPLPVLLLFSLEKQTARQQPI